MYVKNSRVRIFVLLGASGSGKTELAINLAMKARSQNRQVCFFDMDQTKGLFRSRDFFDILSGCGIETVDTYDFQDAPVVPAGVVSKISSDKTMCVFDVGGNPAGAVMIGQYAGRINRENTAYYYVINPCRPFSDTAEDIEQSLVQILSASRIQPEWIQIISNPNMGGETTAALVLERHRQLEGLLSRLGMKPSFLCCRSDLAGEVEAKADVPVIPLQLYLRRLY